MRTDTEKEYLLKALDAIFGRFILISPDYTLLAVNRDSQNNSPETMAGQKCHKVFYKRSSPCQSCPAAEAFQTHRPTLMPDRHPQYQSDNDLPCRYFYPLGSAKPAEAMAVLDFNIPAIDRLDDTLKQSNAFLKKPYLRVPSTASSPPTKPVKS